VNKNTKLTATLFNELVGSEHAAYYALIDRIVRSAPQDVTKTNRKYANNYVNFFTKTFHSDFADSRSYAFVSAVCNSVLQYAVLVEKYHRWPCDETTNDLLDFCGTNVLENCTLAQAEVFRNFVQQTEQEIALRNLTPRAASGALSSAIRTYRNTGKGKITSTQTVRHDLVALMKQKYKIN